MSRPAVIRAEFTDYRPVKTRKTVILSFEIPAEEQGAAFAALGYPVMGSSIWVAIARLQEGAGAPSVPEKAVEPAKVEKAEGDGSKSLAWKAGAVCAESGFQQWLKARYWTAWHEVPLCEDNPHATATAVLKWALGIASRKELNMPGPKADAFNAMLTSYDYRNQVRA